MNKSAALNRCQDLRMQNQVDMFNRTKDDLCPQVDEILKVGEFYEMSAGAQIIFT